MTKTERRRRTGNVGALRQRLSLPPGFIPNEKFKYRWANDDGARLSVLTEQDDWDFVTVKGEKSRERTGAISHHIGTKEDGQPLRAFLLRKPVEYYDEDKAAEQAAIDEKMKQIKRGPTPDAEGLGSLKPEHSYTAGIAIQE